MKKAFLFIFSAIALLNLVSCYEDEGNYDYVDLQRFIVDTTGVNMSITVTQFDQLSVPSRLVYDGNKGDLDYYWVAYKNETYGDNPSDTLARTENLNEEITLSPGSYLLEFLAVVKETGRRSSMQYNLTVESAVGSGLLVFYKKNDVCDVDIVKTKTVVGSLTEDKLVRNIYSRIDDNVKLHGKPWLIACVGSDYIELLTDCDGTRVSPDDMGKMSDWSGMFWDTPTNCLPQGFFDAGWGSVALVNDGEVFYLNGGWAAGGPLYPGGKTMNNDTYYAAPWVIFAYGGEPFCYDMWHGRFLTCASWSSLFQPAGDEKLRDLKMEMYYMGKGYSGSTSAYYAFGVMKSLEDTSWHLYAVNANTNPSDCKLVADFDMSQAPEFNNALYYDFSTVSPLFYYASATSVYVCPFTLDNATAAIPSAPSWTCPAGEEITYMKLFTQDGIGVEESLAYKLLMVATWNGSEGKGYLLKTDLATGVIDTTPIETFGGFGEVGSIAFKSN